MRDIKYNKMFVWKLALASRIMGPMCRCRGGWWLCMIVKCDENDILVS